MLKYIVMKGNLCYRDVIGLNKLVLEKKKMLQATDEVEKNNKLQKYRKRGEFGFDSVVFTKYETSVSVILAVDKNNIPLAYLAFKEDYLTSLNTYFVVVFDAYVSNACTGQHIEKKLFEALETEYNGGIVFSKELLKATSPFDGYIQILQPFTEKLLGVVKNTSEVCFNSKK